MKHIVFHPLLLALFPALSLFVNNRGQISAIEMLEPIVAVSILAALFWFLTHRLVRDKYKSSILTSVFLILFFSFGHSMNLFLFILASQGWLDSANAFIQSRTCQIIAALLWLILLVLVSYLVKKSHHALGPVSQFLNMFSIVLVALAAFTWFTWRAQEANAFSFIDTWYRSVRAAETANQTKDIPSIRPNIFYIIVDEYARADIFNEMYGYDNSPFYAYLAEKGFCVADQSTANYSQTYLSLASSLNSIYLDDLVNKLGRQSTNRLALEAMLQDNLLLQRMHSFGYTTLAFASGYSGTELRTADIFKSPPTSLTGFENELLRTTPIPTLLELPFLMDEYALQRDRILYTFDHLADATQLPSPVFVFAHIAVPHPPFLFGAQGEPMRPNRQISSAQGIEFVMNVTEQEYVQSYRNQAIFVTTRLRTTIDAILSNSRGPVIIILQADHGPDSKQQVPSDEKTRYRERMSIFSAFYVPDREYDLLCPSVTPVNIFRIITNRYLGTNFEILENKNYFSNYDYPYALIDVTNQLRP